MTIRNIGKINIGASDVVLGDPFYDFGAWCQGMIRNVLLGEYSVVYFATQKERYNNSRIGFGILHNKQNVIPFEDLKWEAALGYFGVDAGMVSISDANTYQNWHQPCQRDIWWDNMIFGDNGIENNDISIFDNGILCNKFRGNLSVNIAKNQESKIIGIKVEL